MYCFSSSLLVALIGLEANPVYFFIGRGSNLDLHFSMEFFYSYNPGQNCWDTNTVAQQNDTFLNLEKTKIIACRYPSEDRGG